MSIHRRAAKRDTSEGPIVEALEAAGFSVARISGANVPDLLLGRQGVSRVVEVKTGTKKLKPGQRDWWAAWKGNAPIVLRTPSEAVTLAKYWSLLDPVLTTLIASE